MDQLSPENAFASVEFAENPEPRVPCVLIVDTSTSMHGPRIDELNKGLQVYQQELLNDPLAAKRVEVAIVTFGGRVSRLVDFVSATEFQPPKLQVIGGTPMGAAITEALDMIEQRKTSYREHGIAYYRPWAFLITDGEPNDHWKPVCSRVAAGEKDKSFCFFAVGVEGANMEVLAELCVRQPLWLQGLKFGELFSWLSNSQQMISRSTPGDEVPLVDPTSGPRGRRYRRSKASLLESPITIAMTNDEDLMTKETRMPNTEGFLISSLGILASFVIRHLTFVINIPSPEGR